MRLVANALLAAACAAACSCVVDVPDPKSGVFKCDGDDDCISGFACKNGICRPQSDKCSCTAGQICIDETCIARVDLCSPNKRDGRCPDGLKCDDGICFPLDEPCSPVVRPCGTGKVCRFESSCLASGAPCSSVQSCDDDVCVASESHCEGLDNCIGDAECPGGWCREQACIYSADLCRPDRPGGWWCPGGLQCVGGTCRDPTSSCSPGDTCGAGIICSPVGGSCSESAVACGQGATMCADGEVCIVLWGCPAADPCAPWSPAGPCPDPSVYACQNGVCVANDAVCGPQRGCPEGTTCTMDAVCGLGGACGPTAGCSTGDVCILDASRASCDCSASPLPPWAQNATSGNCASTCAFGCIISDTTKETKTLDGAQVSQVKDSFRTVLALADYVLALRADGPTGVELFIAEVGTQSHSPRYVCYDTTNDAVVGPAAGIDGGGAPMFAMACRNAVAGQCFNGTQVASQTSVAVFRWEASSLSETIRGLDNVYPAAGMPDGLADIDVEPPRLAISMRSYVAPMTHSVVMINTGLTAAGNHFTAQDVADPSLPLGPIAVLPDTLQWTTAGYTGGPLSTLHAQWTQADDVMLTNFGTEMILDVRAGTDWSVVLVEGAGTRTVYFVDGSYQGTVSAGYAFEWSSRVPESPIRAGGDVVAWARDMGDNGVEIRATKRANVTDLSINDSIGIAERINGVLCNGQWRIDDFAIDSVVAESLTLAYVASCWSADGATLYFRDVYTRRF